jgi:hypothetical protein
MLFLLTALLFSGCAMRTVEQMYALPKRSEEFNEMQSAIDTAMYGMTYASPQSGENQQTVQMADLNGDGTDEIIVFAKGATEKPLQVLIFTQDEEGKVRTMETIGSNGLAFEQVEYVDFDNKPGSELVVGIRVGDQVQRSVSVYTFRNGDAELLSEGYAVLEYRDAAIAETLVGGRLAGCDRNDLPGEFLGVRIAHGIPIDPMALIGGKRRICRHLHRRHHGSKRSSATGGEQYHMASRRRKHRCRHQNAEGRQGRKSCEFQGIHRKEKGEARHIEALKKAKRVKIKLLCRPSAFASL